MTSNHPVTQLLLNAGLGAVDFSHLGAVLQARRQAELAAIGNAPTSAPEDMDKESEEGNLNRLAQKRNPNDLNTAAPVTSMDEFAKFPISTKLNNLKLPGNLKVTRLYSSVNNRPLKVFPSHYLPRDLDVVVDMAHYPNREFRNLIRQSLPNYLTSSQPKRKSLISAILRTVSGGGGHFIRFWSSRQAWAEVEMVHAEKFVAQALQDAASHRGSFAQSMDDAIPSSGSNAEGSGVNQTKSTNDSSARRVSLSERERKNSCTAPIASSLQEIPVVVRKRRSQTVPSNNDPADRSALLVKFKRPKTTPRKVSLEERNPLKFLSQIAAMDDSESGYDSE
ncbi:hypothetical protein ACA910_016396 [Epithemia clementina (nom. ined.)]